MRAICYRCGGGEAPENTIEGINNCINIDSSWTIEVDLQLTKDQQIGLGSRAQLNADILAIPEKINWISILNKRLVKQCHVRGKEIWVFGDELNKILKERASNLPISSQDYSLETLS